MTTGDQNHEYALAIIERKHAEIAALRAERDALRKVDDAMVERAWTSIAAACGTVHCDEYHRLLPSPHIDNVERDDIRAALDAALAVQPTTEGL